MTENWTPWPNQAQLPKPVLKNAEAPPEDLKQPPERNKEKKLTPPPPNVNVSEWGTQNASSARRDNMEMLNKHAYILHFRD